MGVEAVVGGDEGVKLGLQVRERVEVAVPQQPRTKVRNHISI
jgi:hypothetical protein